MIKETEWKSPVNQLIEVKHIWACKNGRCMVAVAHRTTEDIGFTLIPMIKDSSVILMQEPKFEDNSDRVRKEVQEWFDSET